MHYIHIGNILIIHIHLQNKRKSANSINIFSFSMQLTDSIRIFFLCRIYLISFFYFFLVQAHDLNGTHLVVV